MDTTTAIILIVVIFAVIVLAGFLIYRRNSEVDIDTPLGKLRMKGSNKPSPEPPKPMEQPSVVVKGAKSRKGGLTATDKTGRGTFVEEVDVEKDIVVTSETPNEKSDPKA